jgi:arylsulfatase A-like enzyme
VRRARPWARSWLAGALLALCVGCDGDGGEPGGDGPAPAADAPDFSNANLVIISLDTLRADGLSVGGGPKGISPTLQAFADEAIVFSNARAQAPETAPSHMSLFTSTYPSVHGVQNVAHEKNEATGVSRPIIVPLREDIPTLAEVLAAAGFRNIGLTDGGNLNPPHGFARGFEEYTYDLSGAKAQVDDGIRWVRELGADDGNRFFLFWHTYQIHAPYVPPEPHLSNWATAKYDGPVKARIEKLSGMDFKQRFGAMRDVFWKDRETFGWPESAYLHGLYRGEIAYTDLELSRLFGAMEASGVFDDSIVIVLSDHGEEFFEHGRWQHEQLYDECLRVPLIVRLPGGWGGGRVIDAPVGLIDVMPTVLELLDVGPARTELPGRIRNHGQSLAPALTQTGPVRNRPVISEHVAMRGGNWTWLVSVEANGTKLIQDQVRGRKLPDGTIEYERQVFDLGNDPNEIQDISKSGLKRVDALLDLHEGFLKMVEIEGAGAGELSAADLDCDTIEQMIQLGYLGADAADDCPD